MTQSKSASKPESSFTSFLVKLALFVLVLRSFVFAPFSIPSESMLPRLLIGDYLIVAKWPYGFTHYSIPFSPPLWSGRLFGRDPERGDVVVFKAPPNQRQDYIKRVIGLPGDLIGGSDLAPHEQDGGQVRARAALHPVRRRPAPLRPHRAGSERIRPATDRLRPAAN